MKITKENKRLKRLAENKAKSTQQPTDEELPLDTLQNSINAFDEYIKDLKPIVTNHTFVMLRSNTLNII